MAITDAQFASWLRSSAPKCLLVEVQAYSGGVVTRYFSNLGFTSKPTDTPANTAYPDVLQQVPFITSELSEVFGAASRITTGDVIINNADGSLFSWLNDAWDGRPIALYLGDLAWSKADFRKVFTGVVADIRAEGTDRLVLKIRDRQYALTLPVQTTLIGGTDSTKDSRRPICYGECFNISPVLIDSATRTYAVHDGQIDAITAVRAAGVGIAFTPNLANGTFTLGATPAGQLTADVRGSKTGGVYINKTADIIQRIAIERGGLLVGDIDAASITAANAAVPGAVGYYSAQDTTTILNALDKLATGAGMFYSFDNLGVMTVRQFAAPTGSSPVMTISADVAKQYKTELVQRLTPPKSIRLGYGRNFTVQTTVDASVTDANRQRYKDEFLIAKTTIAAAQFLLAEDQDIKPSCFVAQADANTESARLAALWGIIRKVYRVHSFNDLQQLKLGDEVTLQLNSFGLSAGVPGRVVGITASLTGNATEVKIFT